MISLNTTVLSARLEATTESNKRRTTGYFIKAKSDPSGAAYASPIDQRLNIAATGIMPIIEAKPSRKVTDELSVPDPPERVGWAGFLHSPNG